MTTQEPDTAGTPVGVGATDLSPMAHAVGTAAPAGRTLVPDSASLANVLPTDRLNERGRAIGDLRQDLYRIPNARNVLNVAGVWVQSVGVLAVACWVSHPLTWVAAFLLMGRAFALFAILSHEAAHRLLFSNRSVNDWVGRWLLAPFAFVPIDLYRRGHMAHHKVEFGPDEPDLAFYAGYPMGKASWRRKLVRDAVGVSGWKNLKPLLRALGSRTSRPIALRIVGAQAILIAVSIAAGYPLLWPLLWLAPWMTVWRVLNRLRSVAEHGGMIRSQDRRQTTHVIRQTWPARFWIVPFNTGWHLAHHVDIGVPFQRLPKLHRELVQAGWVTPDLEHPNYRSFWRTATSG